MIKLVLQMLINLILTIFIELGISLLLGIRKRNDINNIIYINCITNIVLNYIINILSMIFYKNILLVYVTLGILEILVIFIEYIYYKNNLKSKINPLLLSIILNTLSFTIGLFIIKK